MKHMKLFKRRRTEGKTDYRKRLILLTGDAHRLVVRKSNRYILLQIIDSVQARDSVRATFSTKDLISEGWPKDKAGSLKSIGAAYLVGYALGKKVTGTIKGRVILDSGLTPHTKGSRMYAVIKGFSDAGMKINFSESVIPTKEKIEKEEFFKKVKANIDKKQ